MKNAWRSWKKILEKAAKIQADIILTIVYFIIIVPLSYLIRLTNKKSFLPFFDDKDATTYWHKKPPAKHTLEWAKRQ